MELEEYKIMFQSEEKHWWYRGLHDLVFSTIRRIFPLSRNIRILDAGCGTGMTMKILSRYDAFGIDVSQEALSYCKKRNLKKILKASVMQMPFKNNSFDLIISNDVLYHKLVNDDQTAFKEIHRVLRNSGFLISNLPAHNFLRRTHDIRIHTRHRYTKREISFKLKERRFKIVRVTYRNLFLLAPLLFLKLINKKRKSLKFNSGLRSLNPIINSSLYGISRIENFLIRNINMPFGTSIFFIAEK